MAEQRYQDQPYHQRATDAAKGLLPDKAPSKSQVLAVVTLLPVGGFFLLLSGLSLTGSLLGLAVTTPLFVIFSPILVPAALTVGLAVAGFLTSGALGITALSALSWIINYIRRGRMPEHAKRRVQDTTGYMGQKSREVGQKGQESART